MHRKGFRSLRALGFSIALLLSAGFARAQFTGSLRIVSWNIEDDINGATTPLPGLDVVLQGIGNETVGADAARPPDILGLEETTSNAATVAPIVTDLNNHYLGLTYKMSTYQATESGGDTADGNGPNALVYNSTTLTLLQSTGVGSASGSSNGEYRQVVRYEFQPVNGTSPFYVYVSHMKSGSGTSNTNYRNEEATIIRNDEATLPANSSVLYTGDFNQSPAPTNLTASGTGQGIDPENGSTTQQYLSESATSLYYRDDYQLYTANIQNGTGAIKYVAGSFHYFGNNGTTPVNASVNSPSTTGGTNTALAYMTSAAGYNPTQSQVLSALTTASDHLPAIADYTYTIAPEPGSCSLAAASLAFALARRRRPSVRRSRHST